MIKSIRLANWRSHADTKLEFRKGTNLLVGIMGAGKSSVIEGISFALYGTFPAMERRKIRLENVVRLNEPGSSVTLEFEWDGALYRVERTLERSKRGVSTEAELFKDGMLIEHGQVAVTTHIASMTGVDYDLFTRAIYSEQNNIDHFLNLDPRRRKEELDALLGLDRFETARSNAINVLNRIRAKREGIEQRFSRQRLGELAKKDQEASEEAARLEASCTALSSRALELAKLREEAAKRHAGLRKARDEFERLDKEAMRRSVLIEALSKELDGASPDEGVLKASEESFRSLSEKRSGLQETIRAMDARLSNASRESGMIDSRIRLAEENSLRSRQLRDELSALLAGRTPGQLAEAQKSLSERLLAAESGLMSERSQAREIEDSAARLKDGMSECPVCSSPLGEDGIEHVRKEKDAKLEAGRIRMKELESSISALRKESESLSLLVKKASSLEEKIKLLSKEAPDPAALAKKRLELEAESAKYGEERKRLGEEADALLSAIEKLRAGIASQKSLIAKARSLEESKAGLEKARAGLAAMSFSPEEFEKAGLEADRLNIEAEKARSEMASMELRRRHAGELRAELSRELALLRHMEVDVGSLYALEEELSLFKNALVETQSGLRGSLSEAINNAMNEIWSIFYPYRNYHGLRLLASDKDYSFEVNDGADWKGLESVASGGERACAALALRMSLAMVLTPKLGWLVLDEPTHNLDAEAVELLSHALQFKVPEVVRQTFVITHDEAFMGSDFASSFRITREKDDNGPSRAEPA